MNYSLEHNKYAKVNFTPENPCWFNFYGSYLIKTTYDENTRKYTEEKIPFDYPHQFFTNS